MIEPNKKQIINSQNRVDVELCKRFKEIRKTRKLTQPEFAEILGINRVAVNAIERCQYNPGIGLLRALRSKYKLSYDYIIDGK